MMNDSETRLRKLAAAFKISPPETDWAEVLARHGALITALEPLAAAEADEAPMFSPLEGPGRTRPDRAAPANPAPLATAPAAAPPYFTVPKIL